MIRSPRFSFFVAALSFLIGLPTCPTIFAQTEKSRPKIGLVLSGGAARGTAHVGALKALEELNIPIDAIVGNSMGAIIGGLYSAGMSPDEIEHWFETADWYDLFDDRPARSKQAFRSKAEELNLIQNFEVGISPKKIKLAAGLVSGDKLLATLRRFALPVAHINNFDDLGVPFKAIATDINTGELVVLDKGDLPLAMRASMSVPGAFTPITYDGRLLVDGLVVSNLPISTAKKMGVDIIIAIDVAEPVVPIQQNSSALDITAQMMRIMGSANDTREKALLEEDDVYVAVDLKGALSTDFVHSASFIELGYESVMAMRDQFSQLSVSSELHSNEVSKQRKIRERDITLDFIRFTDTGRIPEKTVRRRIKSKAGEPLDFDQLALNLGAIKQFQNYSLVDGRIVEEDGEWGLLIDTHEKSWGPNYLKFGFVFNTDFKSESEMTTLLSYRMRELNDFGGEFLTRAQIGDDESIFGEFYQPLEYSRTFFVAPFAGGKRFEDIGQSADGDAFAFRGHETMWGTDLGMRLGTIGEIRFGYSAGSIDVDRLSRIDGLGNSAQFDTGNLHGSFTIDTMDSLYFPRKGLRTETTFTYNDEALFSDETYNKATFSFVKPITHGAITVAPFATAEGRVGDSPLPIYDQAALGGFGRMPGVEVDQLQDQYGINGGLFIYRQMGKLPPGLGTGWYLGGSLELGNVFTDTSEIAFNSLLPSASAFIGMETRLGSLYLGSGFTEGFDPSVFLFLGQPF